MKLSKAIGPILGLLLVASGVACKQEGPAEQAGKEMDRGVERAGEAMERAGDRAKDRTDR